MYLSIPLTSYNSVRAAELPPSEHISRSSKKYVTLLLNVGKVQKATIRICMHIDMSMRINIILAHFQ